MSFVATAAVEMMSLARAFMGSTPGKQHVSCEALVLRQVSQPVVSPPVCNVNAMVACWCYGSSMLQLCRYKDPAKENSHKIDASNPRIPFLSNLCSSGDGMR